VRRPLVAAKDRFLRTWTTTSLDTTLPIGASIKAIRHTLFEAVILV
jgi:hypothetical protein